MTLSLYDILALVGVVVALEVGKLLVLWMQGRRRP